MLCSQNSFHGNYFRRIIDKVYGLSKRLTIWTEAMMGNFVLKLRFNDKVYDYAFGIRKMVKI